MFTRLVVEFDATTLFGGIPKLEFIVEVTSDSDEINNMNNKVDFIQVEVKAFSDQTKVYSFRSLKQKLILKWLETQIHRM